jgi:hypothetical protein
VEQSVRAVEATLNGWMSPFIQVYREAQATRSERPHRPQGVFVIEGVFEPELTTAAGGYRGSARPLLEYARSSSRTWFPYRHVRATTREQLARRVRAWRYRRDYPLLLLLTHGNPGCIAINPEEDEIKLRDLASMIGSSCEGRVVFFGGCSVTRDKQRIQEFVDTTGISLAIGFDDLIGELPLGAFVLLLLQAFNVGANG